jgi:hypothetical protein
MLWTVNLLCEGDNALMNIIIKRNRMLRYSLWKSLSRCLAELQGRYLLLRCRPGISNSRPVGRMGPSSMFYAARFISRIIHEVRPR